MYGVGRLFHWSCLSMNARVHKGTNIHCSGTGTKLSQGLSTQEGHSGSVRSRIVPKSGAKIKTQILT